MTEPKLLTREEVEKRLANLPDREQDHTPRRTYLVNILHYMDEAARLRGKTEWPCVHTHKDAFDAWWLIYRSVDDDLIPRLMYNFENYCPICGAMRPVKEAREALGQGEGK